MFRLYLDENISEQLGDALVVLAIDAISANRANKGLDDATQLLIASQLGRVLVTHNTGDFSLLHRAWVTWSVAWVPSTLPKHAGMFLVHTAPDYGHV